MTTIGPHELHGVMAMMPAFATPDAGSVDAVNTVAVDNLRAAVDRIIGDGIDVLATTGSFGEFHTLLGDEFEVLAHATVDAVAHRVPVMIGCTALHSREVVRKMQVARDAGADGVLVGVPFYFPATVDNAVQFFREIAERFPDLAIMIYHNPTLHHVTLPPQAFHRLIEFPNIVGMKDSHRDTAGFLRLQAIIKDRISVFVNARQLYPFQLLGAAGCWSYDVWMGPWPILALRDAVACGDYTEAQRLMFAASSAEPPDLRWRETLAKIAIRYAGYCDPGPLRPPFVLIPEDVDRQAREKAQRWQAVCAEIQTAARR